MSTFPKTTVNLKTLSVSQAEEEQSCREEAEGLLSERRSERSCDRSNKRRRRAVKCGMFLNLRDKQNRVLCVREEKSTRRLAADQHVFDLAINRKSVQRRSLLARFGLDLLRFHTRATRE